MFSGIDFKPLRFLTYLRIINNTDFNYNNTYPIRNVFKHAHA